MATPFTFEETTQYELENNYPNLWATIKRDFKHLSIDEQARIGSLVIGTCCACHDADSKCRCWNDE